MGKRLKNNPNYVLKEVAQNLRRWVSKNGDTTPKQKIQAAAVQLRGRIKPLIRAAPDTQDRKNPLRGFKDLGEASQLNMTLPKLSQEQVMAKLEGVQQEAQTLLQSRDFRTKVAPMVANGELTGAQMVSPSYAAAMQRQAAGKSLLYHHSTTEPEMLKAAMQEFEQNGGRIVGLHARASSYEWLPEWGDDSFNEKAGKGEGVRIGKRKIALDTEYGLEIQHDSVSALAAMAKRVQPRLTLPKRIQQMNADDVDSKIFQTEVDKALASGEIANRNVWAVNDLRGSQEAGAVIRTQQIDGVPNAMAFTSQHSDNAKLKMMGYSRVNLNLFGFVQDQERQLKQRRAAELLALPAALSEGE